MTGLPSSQTPSLPLRRAPLWLLAVVLGLVVGAPAARAAPLRDAWLVPAWPGLLSAPPLGPEAPYAPALHLTAARRAASFGLFAHPLVLTREWMAPDASSEPHVQPIDLRTYSEPRFEQPPKWRAYMRGRYGIAGWGRSDLWLGQGGPGPVGPRTDLEWQVARSLEFPFDGHRPSLQRAWTARTEAMTPAIASACRLHQVTLVRTNGERDILPLVDCDGAVTAEALDRVSVLGRPYGIDRPVLPLPDQPEAAANAQGEWVAGIKLVHPRLVWVMNAIARRFGGRPLVLVSGYRPQSIGSNHARGRAMDLRVLGVSNESVFAYCRTLSDVGCGYYPNSTFVHVDVRPAHAGQAVWVDISGPGEPAEYVSSWPGVLEPASLGWARGER